MTGAYLSTGTTLPLLYCNYGLRERFLETAKKKN
jgi:hypothetical protein